MKRTLLSAAQTTNRLRQTVWLADQTLTAQLKIVTALLTQSQRSINVSKNWMCDTVIMKINKSHGVDIKSVYKKTK